MIDRPSPLARITLSLISFWLTITALVPIMILVVVSWLSRHETNLVSLPWGIHNYARLLDPTYLAVLSQSLLWSFATTALCIGFGYPFAAVLARLPQRYQTLALIAILVPFWTNSVIRLYGVKLLLGKQGLLNAALLNLGLINSPLELLYTPGAVILGMIYIFFPFAVLPLYAKISKLDPQLFEAAHDLYASKLRVFTQIELPLMMPAILAAGTLTFLPSLGAFYASGVLGGSREILLGSAIENQFLEARDWPFGSAMSMALFVLMGLMLLGIRLVDRLKTGAK